MSGFEIKNFRHNNPQQRLAVMAEIENTWTLIDGMTNGNAIEVKVTSSMVDSTLIRLKSEELDGYDAFMIEAMLGQGIKQVITDDGDFGQVQGITVFTANNLLIEEAAKQGKLKKR